MVVTSAAKRPASGAPVERPSAMQPTPVSQPARASGSRACQAPTPKALKVRAMSQYSSGGFSM